MSAKPSRNQQSDALFPALHELLQGFGAPPAGGRAGSLESFALPGTLGYLIEDEFIHFAPVALWWRPEGFVHSFDNRMNTAFDEHDVLHVLSGRPGVACGFEIPLCGGQSAH